MSFSLTVTAATKEELVDAFTKRFAEEVAAVQASHLVDRDAAIAAVGAYVGFLCAGSQTGYRLDVSGYLSWSNTDADGNNYYVASSLSIYAAQALASEGVMAPAGDHVAEKESALGGMDPDGQAVV